MSFAFARLSRLAIYSLSLSTVAAGCGTGPQAVALEPLVERSGPAPLYGDECESVEEGTYLLSYLPTAGTDPSAIQLDLDIIKQAGGALRKSFFPELPMIAATVPPEALSQLRSNPHLAFISKNCKYWRQSETAVRVPWASIALTSAACP